MRPFTRFIPIGPRMVLHVRPIHIMQQVGFETKLCERHEHYDVRMWMHACARVCVWLCVHAMCMISHEAYVHVGVSGSVHVLWVMFVVLVGC